MTDPDYSLLPFDLLRAPQVTLMLDQAVALAGGNWLDVVRALAVVGAVGARKPGRGANDWRTNPNLSKEKYEKSFAGHLARAGTKDDETGEDHLIHAIWNRIILDYRWPS